MLSNYIKKIKPHEKDILLVMVIVLTALTSFGLGRLSRIRENKMPITIENLPAAVASVSDLKKSEPTIVETTEGKLVASKNGTKYHFPWCSGAKRIKESNKIWFASKEEAEKAGYTPAVNCKGL